MAPPTKKKQPIPTASIDEICSITMNNEPNIALGYRFCPTDAELVVGYLAKKIKNLPLPSELPIKNANLYDFTPDQFAAAHDNRGQEEWYFFTEREKFKDSNKTFDRVLKTGDGYWISLSSTDDVIYEGRIVGSKGRLGFCEGKTRAKGGNKTDWILIEYSIQKSDTSIFATSLCKLYKKKKYKRGPSPQSSASEPSQKKSDNDLDLDLKLSLSEQPQQDIPDS